MEKDKLHIYLNSAGIVATIIACIIAVLMIPYSDIKRYLIEHQKWAFPIIIILSYLLFLAIGELIGYQYAIKKFKLNKKGFWDLLDKEALAKEVWILTSNITYDINNDKFRNLVQSNMQRGVKYRYLVPQYPNLQIDVNNYKDVHNLSEDKMNEIFTFYEVNEISKFINNIVIFDPYTNHSETYFFSNVNNEGNDYILLNNEETTFYKDMFIEAWTALRGERP